MGLRIWIDSPRRVLLVALMSSAAYQSHRSEQCSGRLSFPGEEVSSCPGWFTNSAELPACIKDKPREILTVVTSLH